MLNILLYLQPCNETKSCVAEIKCDPLFGPNTDPTSNILSMIPNYVHCLMIENELLVYGTMECTDYFTL